VKDYKVWRAAFDSDSSRRTASGFTFVAVESEVEKPNNVKIVLMVSDMAKAKAFAADPGLKTAMDKGGVISKPEMKYWKIVRFNPENQKGLDTRLEIVHKVKNFDAWLKGFDAEGAATRAANGMADVALGRGVEDSTLVHIVFEVNDLAKVKARLADPALKKIMMDAGVVGKPTITFYKDASK
jgi:catechol 2,3-dioxygenase-like lactoylglutathione lyase family enzyme